MECEKKWARYLRVNEQSLIAFDFNRLHLIKQAESFLKKNRLEISRGGCTFANLHNLYNIFI